MFIANTRIDRFHLAAFALRLALLLLLCVAGTGFAKAAVFPALDHAAIAVRNPAGVRLIGITRAGDRLVAVGEHGVIIYSDDNGQSWRQAAVPVSVTLTCVAFANAREGWAAGDYGVILHTSDGGATWQKQIDGRQVNRLMSANAQAYDAAHTGTPAAARAVRRAEIFAAAGPDKPFLSMLVLSPKQVMVFGAYRMAVATSDGGAHWKDISLTIDDPVSHNIYGVAKAQSGIYLAMETGLVLQSTDAGANFKLLNQPVQATLFGVILPVPDTIIVYGVAGNMYRSTDAGVTWSPVNLGTDANLTAARLVTPDNALIVATQQGHIYVSHDNGATFHVLPQNVGMEIYDLEETADGDIVCVGDHGVRVIEHASLLTLRQARSRNQ